MAESLKLAELFKHDGMSEVDICGGGIETELDAEWATEPEFFEEFLFGKDLGGAGSEQCELVFGRHGAWKWKEDGPEIGEGEDV